jgi:hypothetical protein
VDVANVNNDRLFGVAPKRPPKTARRAAARAAGALERYLNGAFVKPDTRFTKAPVRAFLTRDARRVLSARDLAALGVGMRSIQGGRTGNAEASAFVLHAGQDVISVTLRYTARLRFVTADDRPQQVLQSGSVLMLRIGKGWKAEMVDVELRTR